MKLTFPKKSLLILIASGVGLVVVILSIFWVSGILYTHSQAVAKSRALVARLTRTSEFLAQLKGEAPQADAYAQHINLLLAGEEQIIDFQAWIQNLAKIHNVTLSADFNGDQVTPDEGPGYIHFNMDASGSLDNLTAFLKEAELQTSKFLISVDGFTINQNSTAYQFSGRGRVYFARSTQQP